MVFEYIEYVLYGCEVWFAVEMALFLKPSFKLNLYSCVAGGEGTSERPLLAKVQDYLPSSHRPAE